MPVKRQASPLETAMRYEIKSSLIDALEYRSENGFLKLYLRNGQVRELHDVPSGKVQELLKASSPGHYYLNKLKQYQAE